MYQRVLAGGSMKLIVAALLASLLTSCAADTMRSYVGQDIRNVELAYGPPINQIDLGNGSRAFQWAKVSVDTTPVSAITTTDKDKKGRKTTQTRFTGGDQTVTRCLYTFITTRKADSWIVTGIREPSLDCAIGDLG
jgi:predicted small secreted protein